MTGYWPSCFFCIYMDRDEASLVNKGFIIWDKTPKHDMCTCGTKPVS